MIRVVLNTSVWISGIFWHGLPHRLLRAWRDGMFEVIVSAPLLAELQRKLNEKVSLLGASPELAAEWLDVIAVAAIFVEPQENIQVCRDPNDDMFLEAAVAGRADYLISGDQDLLAIGSIGKTLIVSPRQAWEMLSKETERQ